MADNLRISMVQSHIIWEDRDENLGYYGELLRRVSGKTDIAVLPETFTTGFSMDVEKHEVLVDGNPVTLTYKEFELLCYLMENEGIVLSRDRLLSKIWGYDFDGETRTVDVHIRTLRQKLGIGGSIIETIRGVGYKADSCGKRE